MFWKFRKFFLKMSKKIYAPLFSFFAFHSIFIRTKSQRFCGLFFRSINKTRNSHKIRKLYCECFVFHDVFHKNTHKIPAKCEIQKVYSQLKNTTTLMVTLKCCNSRFFCTRSEEIYYEKNFSFFRVGENFPCPWPVDQLPNLLMLSWLKTSNFWLTQALFKRACC